METAKLTKTRRHWYDEEMGENSINTVFVTPGQLRKWRALYPKSRAGPVLTRFYLALAGDRVRAGCARNPWARVKELDPPAEIAATLMMLERDSPLVARTLFPGKAGSRVSGWIERTDAIDTLIRQIQFRDARSIGDVLGFLGTKSIPARAHKPVDRPPTPENWLRDLLDSRKPVALMALVTVAPEPGGRMIYGERMTDRIPRIRAPEYILDVWRSVGGAKWFRGLLDSYSVPELRGLVNQEE